METDSRKNSNTESKWYCPHYERETCLIHFQCCPEGKLYPCHKCHNEANVVIENPSVKDQENEKALDSSERNTVENTGTSVELAAEGSAADWNNEGDQEENQADVEQQELCESPSNVVETDTNTDTSVEITTAGSAAEWNNGGDRQENLADVEEQELCESSSNVVENTDTSAELTTGSSAPEWNNEADQQDNSEPSGNRDAAIKNSDCKDVKDPKPPPRSVHLEATAFDCTYLRCRECGHQQEFSEKCESCGKVFAKYFCHKCKLLIEKDVDAYHCDKCGICRGNKADNFHCDECNVCLSTSLKGNHKCFTNRGHDPCAICFEEVFSGAVVLPCFHMIHGECGIRLLQFGSQKCPMCRHDIFPPANKEVVIVEDASGQNTLSSLPSLKQLLCKVPNFLTKLWERRQTQPANTQQQRSVEMINLPG